MQSIDTLTADQLASLNAYMQLLRSFAITMGKSLTVANAINAQYASNIFGILNGVTQTDVLNDGTGLAGAVPMKVGDIMTASLDVQAFITAMTAAGMDTRRTELAGANNLI